MLHIVTLVSRREPLLPVAESVHAAWERVQERQDEFEWRLVYHQEKAGQPRTRYFPSIGFHRFDHVVSVPPDACGEPYLRTFVLGELTDGHILWLDDDNLLHPEILEDLLPRIAAAPDSAFVYHQLDKSGALRCRAQPDHMKVNRVDTAQVIAPRSLYGTHVFANVARGTDGMMYETLYRESAARFVFLDRALVYHNAAC